MSTAFVKIAYFNLWQRKSRTVLVIVMIAFGLGAMIFSQGLYDGMIVQMKSDQIRTGGGEITITKDGYQKSKLLADYIKDVPAVEAVLKGREDIQDVTARLRCEGIVSSAKYAQGAVIIGVDVDREARFINYKKPVVRGRFALSPDENTVIIGQGLAEKLKVDLKKKIVIQGQALNKEIVSMASRVAGIIKTNNPDIDNAGVLIAQTQLQKMFQVEGVTEFNILLKKESLLSAVKKEIIAALEHKSQEKLEVFTWKELLPFLLMWEEVLVYFIYISYAIVFLVVALGIFFIIFISIFERIKEFGILTAMGTSFSSIVQIIFFEALIMGGLGYMCGAVSGFLLLILFKQSGVNLSYFSAGLKDIGMAAVMYPDVRFEYFVLGFIAMVISSFAAVIIPAWKLKRLKAVEAIRFV
ncbi:MAG: FtsX-like permease family protein [Candidatus Omnitrophota bacterium]